MLSLIVIVTSVFYIEASRDQFHIPLKYRYFTKSRLKVYPKTCQGVPRIRMRLLKPGVNTFRIYKQEFDKDYIPSGKCLWWIGDRNTLSSSVYHIEQDCLLGDTVSVNLRPNLMCKECILRLSVILDSNDAYDGWYDSCVDFKFEKKSTVMTNIGMSQVNK